MKKTRKEFVEMLIDVRRDTALSIALLKLAEQAAQLTTDEMLLRMIKGNIEQAEQTSAMFGALYVLGAITEQDVTEYLASREVPDGPARAVLKELNSMHDKFHADYDLPDPESKISIDIKA